MKSSAIVSYQLSGSIIQYINHLAIQLKLSRGKTIEYLIKKIQRLEQKNALICSYFALSKDKEALRDQMIEAESDMLAEYKVNPSFE